MEITQDERSGSVLPDPEEKPLLSRILPWVVLLLAALALFYFLNRGCAGAKSKSDDDLQSASGVVTDTTLSAAALKQVEPELKQTAHEIALPSGSKIMTAKGSVIEALSDALAGGSVNPSTPYILDDGEFQGRSAVLTPQFEKELEFLASILKAYPNRKIRIEAHTDNSGSADINQQLSTQQGLAVRTFLQDRGIAASRLTSVGRGQSKPLAPNDSDAGKTQNRRIEVYVE